MKTFVLLLALFQSTNVLAITFGVHRNLAGLQPLLPTDATTQQFSNHFQINDEENAIHLNYNGTHHPDLLNLAHNPFVKHIECTKNNTHLTVHLTQEMNVQSRIGHPMTAVCTSTQAIIYRRIESIQSCGVHCIQMITTKLELHHMFSALSFKLEYTPSDEKTPQRRLLSKRSSSNTVQRSSSNTVRGLASASDVSSFIYGIKNVNEACTLERRRLGFMKKTFTKWKSEAKSTFDDLENDIKSEFQNDKTSGKNRLECAIGKYITCMTSTVVEISITLPYFKPVSLPRIFLF